MPDTKLNTYSQRHKSVDQRFWEKVDKSGDCWEWTANKGTHGHGVFWLNGKQQKAHRVSLLLSGSDVPGDSHVCHHCDNPSCVSPEHLYIGTHADNMRDKVERGRCNAPQGSNHWRSKISEADARDIRLAYGRGDITQSELGDKFGVSQTMIGFIVRMENWTHA